MIAAAVLTALAVVALAAAANGTQNAAANPVVAIGPGGEAVTDSFDFAHQPWTATAASPSGSPR